MSQAVANDYKKVVDLNNNNDGLGKGESTSNVILEEEEFFDAVERQEPLANLNIPLSIFHYKDYNSDFFTSWYNISSEIFKEINRACPEKKILNLALSVLVLPYISFTALGLVIYSRFKADSKTQADVGEDKIKKGETSVPKRLAYGALAAIAIFVNVTVLVALIVPATVALATFYLLNRELVHSLVTALKISMGQYSNKHQNIEVSFHETEVPGPSIGYNMEIKFPPQFKQLLKDLCKNEDNEWFNVTRDSERNTILKLSTNIDLKNGLQPLHNEIRSVIATSIQEFAKTMEELMRLEKKDITYDKLKELLDEFRLKVVDSIGPKLTSHLIHNAYQVAFIQAIKLQQERRGEDFSLEDELKDTLVKQELESLGKELPNEKEVIIKDLKELKIKESLNLTDEDDRLESLMKVGDIDDISDDALPVFKAEWERLIQEGKIAKKTIIDVYKDTDPGKTEEALNDAKKRIEDLKKQGQERYTGIHEKLKAIYDEGKNNLTDDDLKRKLEGLFKFEYGDQEVEQRLVKSVMKRAQSGLSLLGMISLIDQFRSLEEEIKGPFISKKDLKEASDKVNDFIAKIYLEITKCKMQNLFKGQAKGIENSCKLLEREAPDLVEKINSHRVRIEKYLKRPEQPILLRKIIEGSKDLNEYLKDEQKRRGEKHPNTKLIQKHLENNKEILKALEQLKLEEKELLINEKTINDYREELESREKIKFAIIEADLLKAFEHETFDEEAIKKLLEKVELEYYFAEKCIKSPVIKIKDNIKHFCQDLLSPLIDKLVNLLINNISKDNDGWSTKLKKVVGIVGGWLQLGAAPFVPIIYDQNLDEALKTGRNAHKEVETFLQHFYSSYEDIGAFLGNLFSDNGETFKNDVWPKIEEHLHGMWDRFFKDIEFKIGNKLDEVNVTQQQRETVITA